MVVTLGDIHFRDDKKYWINICENFLEWFKNWDKNNEDNILLLAGDLVEEKLLSGRVVDFLDRFLKYSKFKEIHICVGNHDKKEYHGNYQLAYEFYKNKKNVFIYEEATEVTIDNLKVLMLPYYLGTNKFGKPMNEYYSEIYKNKNFSNDYDLVLGHFTSEDKSYFGGVDCISNLDKINTKKLILGHIHTRGVEENTPYIGSVFAGKKNENDYRRSAIIYDGKKWSEERLPLFNEFLTVSYPEELPKSKSITPIYTILNCTSESVARAKYKNIFIRRVTSDIIETPLRKASDMERQFSSIKEMDTKVLFKAFVKSLDIPLEPEIVRDCEKMLNI